MRLFCDTLVLNLTLFLFGFCESYKILGVFPTLYKSHWNIGVSVLKQLTAAGHEVTLISPYELKEPNVRNVLLTNFPAGDKNNIFSETNLNLNLTKFSVNRNMFDYADLPPGMDFIVLPEVFEFVINFTLSHPNVLTIMKESFDVVVLEVFHSEALLGK
jgi:hypothetical protein